MKLSSSAFCKSLLFSAALFTLSYFGAGASAQQQPVAEKKATPTAKFPAAKRQAPEASSDADEDFEKNLSKDKMRPTRRSRTSPPKRRPPRLTKTALPQFRSATNGFTNSAARQMAISRPARA